MAGNGKDEVKLDKSGVFEPDNASWKANVYVEGNGGDDNIQTGNGADFVHAGSGDECGAYNGEHPHHCTVINRPANRSFA